MKKYIPGTARNMRRSRFTCLLALAIMSLSSCKKFVTVEDPPTLLTQDKVFNSDASATAAMVSIYTSMMNDIYGSNGSFVCFAMSELGGMSADELAYTQSSTVTPYFLQFSNHALTPDNTYVGALWSDGYTYIYRANAILEGLASSTGMSDSVKTQLTGEAHFMRAFCYFYLVNIFGDVPLELTTDYTVNMHMPRTAAASVWGQVVADLQTAKTNMSDAYPTSGRLRPNKWTASALLARAFLYQGKWQDAENESTALLNSGVYSTTLPPLTQVFKMTSTEAIWQLQPVAANANTPEGTHFLTVANTQPAFELTPQVLNAFETGDPRLTNWVGFSSTANPSWAYPAKYKAGAGALSEYYVVFRLAEQYLIRAEARIQQGNIAGGVADLNVIRARARSGDTTVLPDVLASLSQSDALSAVMHERQVELFAEWGHRWFDLARTNQATAVLQPLSPPNTWKPGSILYPVPATEILANPALTQNAAY
ncbi:MAG TPA: RagB/SusD family nutrient uptake outer membrane protein [Puia sp.]|nr:RagB/SusD family nutrient uptake outer membrane protein [Puia sp.]